MLKKLLSISILFLNFTGYCKTIIWDFGGILFEPDKLGVAQEIGIYRFIPYMLLDWQNPNIESAIFSILAKIPSDFKYPSKDSKPAGSATGQPLPPIMCEWQAGIKTGPEVVKLAFTLINRLSKEGYFQSKREEELMKASIKTMFNPDILARNVYPVKEGVQLLKECALITDKEGNRKHRNIGFSNFDELSYDKFFVRNKRVFKYFDDVIISAHIHLLKPYRESYIYLIEKLQLDPTDCILIDDQKVNTDGAKACGMKAILIKGHDYHDLRLQLIKHDLLTSAS